MPGAAKWYRSSGAEAALALNLEVAAGAALEWLPQETIVYNGARAKLNTDIALAAGASYIGWEILCLGRTAAGEKFDTGHLHQTMNISVNGELCWSERCRLAGGSSMLTSNAALAGAPVSGIMVAAGRNIPAHLLADCRAVAVEAGALAGISAMPQILVARYLGHSCQQAKQYFIALWQVLRPFMSGRAAVLPRIWST
jgi:urease accessory protein